MYGIAMEVGDEAVDVIGVTDVELDGSLLDGDAVAAASLTVTVTTNEVGSFLGL